MSYTRYHYHFVWTTKNRQPLLETVDHIRILEYSIVSTCRDLGVKLRAVGVMPEHVHVACSIPANVLVMDVVKRLKGASSRRLNQTIFADDLNDFRWQAEYGGFTYSDRSLPDVIAYVRNQRERHANNRLWPDYERTQEPQRDGSDTRSESG